MIFLRPPGVGGNVTPEGSHTASGTGTSGTVTLDNPASRAGQLAIMTVISSATNNQVVVSGWDIVGRTTSANNSTAGVFSKVLTGSETTAIVGAVSTSWLARVEYFSNAGTVVRDWDGPPGNSGFSEFTSRATYRGFSTMAGSLTNLVVAGRSNTSATGWTSLTGPTMEFAGVWTAPFSAAGSVFISSWQDKDQLVKQVPAGTVSGPSALAHTFTYTINPLIATNPVSGAHEVNVSSEIVVPGSSATVFVPVSNFVQKLGQWGAPIGFRFSEPGYGAFKFTPAKTSGFSAGRMSVTLNGDQTLFTSTFGSFNTPAIFSTPVFSFGAGAEVGISLQTDNESRWGVNTVLRLDA